jgi:hypothetical protein
MDPLEFDKYLRGIDNDWEKMSRVRWSALQCGDREAIDGIEFSDFPVPETQYKPFHLSSSGLSEQTSSESEIITYNSEHSKSIAEFTYRLAHKSRLIGLPKAVLTCRRHRMLT